MAYAVSFVKMAHQKWERYMFNLTCAFYWLLYCVARATLWSCSVFVLFFLFSYAADVVLFLETGKGLTYAVFMESVDLRPD